MDWKNKLSLVPQDNATVKLDNVDGVWFLEFSHGQRVDVTEFVYLYRQQARSFKIDQGEFVIAAYAGWVNAVKQIMGARFVSTATSTIIPYKFEVDHEPKVEEIK